MRQLKLLGIATLAIFSIGIAAVSGAQALEFRALPEKLKFEFKSIGKTLLLTLGGKDITCTGVTGSGEFNTPVGENRLGPVEFKFTGCEFPTLKVKCTGLSDTTAGNITFTAEFHIRHLLNPETEKPLGDANLLILLTSPVHFNCSIALILVLGCVASMDLLTKAGGVTVINLLLASMFVDFLQANGDQEPTSVDSDNSLGMLTCELGSKEGTGAEESAGQLGEGTITNFTNSKLETVTALIDLAGTY